MFNAFPDSSRHLDNKNWPDITTNLSKVVILSSLKCKADQGLFLVEQNRLNVRGSAVVFTYFYVFQ